MSTDAFRPGSPVRSHNKDHEPDTTPAVKPVNTSAARVEQAVAPVETPAITSGKAFTPRKGSTQGKDPVIEAKKESAPGLDRAFRAVRDRQVRRVGLPTAKMLAGLRYFEPKHRRVQLDQEQIEERARDAGFANEAEHQRWRRKNQVVGPVIRRSR